MASQGSLNNSGHCGRGLKRPAGDEIAPAAKRIASGTAFEEISVSSAPTHDMADAESSSALDDNLMEMLEGMSFSSASSHAVATTESLVTLDNASMEMLEGISASSASTQAVLPAESLSALDDNFMGMLEGMSVSSASSLAMDDTESSTALDNTSMEMLEGISVSSSSSEDIAVTESSSALDDTLMETLQDMSLSSSTTEDVAPGESSSAISERASLMNIPSELRLNILSHALGSAAGPSGTISVNPRAKMLSDPSGGFHENAGSGKEQSKWHARSGLLQTCHQLREEALEVLYNKTFFARITQYGRLLCIEKDRFSNWLESMGGDEEVLRIRKVTFGAEWGSLKGTGEREVQKGEVKISILKGKVAVEGSQRMAEAPAAKLLKQVDALIATFMAGKEVGQRLDYAEWMLVWDEVQDLTLKGWDSPQ